MEHTPDPTTGPNGDAATKLTAALASVTRRLDHLELQETLAVGQAGACLQLEQFDAATRHLERARALRMAREELVIIKWQLS